MDKIRVIALGGQDEFDKKMTVVEVNDNIFIINCGKKDPDKEIEDLQKAIWYINRRIYELNKDKND